MDWITDKIAIGNYVEAQDAALLKEHGFKSAVSLDGTLSPKQAPEFGMSEIVICRMIDGAGNDLRAFRLVVGDLRRLVKQQPPVFVQCHAGRSRSVAVVAGYLMLTEKLNPDDAVALVASKREIKIASELVDLLFKLGT